MVATFSLFDNVTFRQIPLFEPKPSSLSFDRFESRIKSFSSPCVSRCRLPSDESGFVMRKFLEIDIGEFCLIKPYFGPGTVVLTKLEMIMFMSDVLLKCSLTRTTRRLIPLKKSPS